MAINRPTTKTIISTSNWGIPVTDEINRLTTQSNADHTDVTNLKTNTTPTAWANITVFTNGWVNVPGWQATQYRKIGDIVYLRGYIQNGTANVPAFTMPVGFRPLNNIAFASAYYSGQRLAATVLVLPSGVVQPEFSGSFDLSFIWSTI